MHDFYNRILYSRSTGLFIQTYIPYAPAGVSIHVHSNAIQFFCYLVTEPCTTQKPKALAKIKASTIYTFKLIYLYNEKMNFWYLK